MNLKGEPAFVGRFCGSNRYLIGAREVAFYREALDDRSPLPEALAPPLLHHSECFKFLGEWYLKNLFGNLHARQEWELFAPLRIGTTLWTRSMIVARYTKRGRDYVVNETDIMDAADGRLLLRGRTHQSFLASSAEARPGFVVDEAAARRKPPHAAFPTATGPELPPLEKTVDARRCWMFSGPGKNYHTDREAARQLGFPNIVVQGMMTTCFVSELLQSHFGNGWLSGGKLDVKLTNVLWVDERVTAHAKIREVVREGTHQRVHCDVWVQKTDGTRILVGEASGLQA